MIYKNTSAEPITVPAGPIAPDGQADLPPFDRLIMLPPFAEAARAIAEGRLVPATP